VLRFVRDSGLYDVQVTVQTAFPGTPLYERLRREGRLLHEGAWERCTLFDVSFRPDGMTVADLERGFRELVRQLYDADETRTRRSRFHERLRGARRDATPGGLETRHEW